jgi:trans-2,3-dihydro-3-hydroxyanthranilate isomerase
MAELDYIIVDVFTDTALAGNPLAVVFDTAGLETARMQAIAREFNLSETTFIQRRPDEVEQAEGVRVRIFTTQEELPFAGHPTLGTASVLRTSAPETARDGAIHLALNVGQIPVRFRGPQEQALVPGVGFHGEAARSDALFGEMTQRDPEFGAELDPAEVARLTGLTPEDLDPSGPPQVVSTGTSFAIVVLRSAAALARLKVNHEAATAYLRGHGGRWFYVLAPGQHPDAAQWRARMQFYGGEDPATGSAAGCAISYLVGHGLVQSGERIHVRQGVEIGRPSDIFLSARREKTKVMDVRVGGRTVLVARGKLFLL